MRNLSRAGQPFALLLVLLALLSLSAGCGDHPTSPDASGSEGGASSSEGGEGSASGPATHLEVTDARPAIVLLQPHDDPFWDAFVTFMRAAADDLELRVVVYNAGDGRGVMREQARDALAARPPPAAIVFQNFKQIGVELLDMANRAEVAAFLVNAGVPPEAGAPRRSRAHWVGEMLPDDVSAGATLAERLIDAAAARKLHAADGKLHVVAIHGGAAEQASLDRVAGLERVVGAREDVVLRQVVPGNWNRKQAQAQARGLLVRYPEASVIWCANDNMALGALDGIGAAGGDRVMVGGIDWSPEALPAIRDGRLVCSIGGHFVEGGWAVVLLKDYLDGKDIGVARRRSQMGVITRDNVARYERLLVDEPWASIDFRAFRQHAGREGHDFTWDAIVRAVGAN